MHLHLQWDGPYSFDEAGTLRDQFTDYGVYCIYGAHPVYGANVLLYIGKASAQTFGVRLSQEGWGVHNQDAASVQVYVGRLSGYDSTPSDEQWSHEITLAERLLILAHWPAGNSSGLNVQLRDEVHELHIFNWGKHRSLLPEVSGARNSDLYRSADGYATYGESRRQ